MANNKKTRKRSPVKLYVPSIRSLSRKACPPGQIERKGYTRRYTTAVRERGYTVRRKDGKVYRVYPKSRPRSVTASCVKNLGKPGKGVPVPIGPLHKGDLSKHGYSFRSSEDKRHKALRQAIQEFGALGVYRKLDAVGKLTKLTAPDASRIFKKDRNWVYSRFGPLKEKKD